MKRVYPNVLIALFISYLFLNGNANATCGVLRIDYDRSVSGWFASAWYTKCNGTPDTFRAYDYINYLEYMPGTEISIGPAGSASSPLVITKEQTEASNRLHVHISGPLANPHFELVP